MNILKSNNYKNISKEEAIEHIRKYLGELKELYQRDNIDSDDFDSPSWAYKQAYNCGAIKTINRVIEYLPKS